MAASVKANTWGRVARLFARLLLTALVGLIFAAAAIVTVLPRATHGAALTVLSGSMTPHLPVGSVVLIRPVDPGTLHVGDVATYQKEPGKAEYITHRIVGINTSTTPTTFTFKGDANRGPDINPVPATAIRGKVWFSVPYLGTIRDAVHTKGVLFLLAVVGLVGYALFQVTSALRERRRAGGEARHRGVPSSDTKAAADELPTDPLATDPPTNNAPTNNAPPNNAPPALRQVLVMTFRAGRTGRLAPEPVAWALGGVILQQSVDTFAVVVIETAERLPMTLALLETLEPLRVQRFELVADTFCVPATAIKPHTVDLEAGRLVLVADGRDE
jgi:signal peptidase